VLSPCFLQIKSRLKRKTAKTRRKTAKKGKHGPKYWQ